MKVDELGLIAYRAYFNRSNGRSLISGADLPTWEKLPREVRDAWIFAADAVLGVVVWRLGEAFRSFIGIEL